MLDEREMRRMARSQRRSRARRRVAATITDPSFTFVMQLFGAPLVAVQLDRLTRDDGTGSVSLMVLGIVLLALSLWFARSRESVLEAQRDYNESQWLEDRFTTIITELTDAIEKVDQATYDRHRELLAELAEIQRRVTPEDV